ncbi:hypothetical protein [Pseudonocardia sp. DLS-67]
MSSDSAADIIEVLAEFLLAQPTALANLLALHVDDGSGACRTCAVGGQHCKLAWPCSLRIAADRALALGGRRTPR